LVESATDNGSIAHALAQLASAAPAGTRSIGGPGTSAPAAAICAARRPAARAAASDSSGAA
jgi:hypothetical protein